MASNIHSSVPQAPAPDAAAFRREASAIEGPALRSAFALERIAFTGRFGVELEMVGITLQRMREVVAAHLGSQARLVGGGVLDRAGRLWEVKPDQGDIVELATPPLCGLQDMRGLAALAQRLHAAGAVPTTETGVHVHVDAKGMTEAQIVRLLALVARHETDLMSALRVHPARAYYCAGAPRAALAPMLHDVPQSRPALMRAYRGHRSVKFLGTNVEHLAPSRFGTLEFRYFNGTLNPAIIGCHVGLAMAMVRFAHRPGPMPTAESLSGGGDLATFLGALQLQPHDPSSLYLFRNLMGLCLPRQREAPALYPRPARRDIGALAGLGASREAVIDLLGTLPETARSALVDAAEAYVKALKLRRLDTHEMLALSRLSPSAATHLLTQHTDTLTSLSKAWERAEAITWLAAHGDQLHTLQAAFEGLSLRYMIAAPLPGTLALLDRLTSMGLPKEEKYFSVMSFQRLAYMDAPRLALHLEVWQQRMSEEPPDQWRVALAHTLQCLHTVPTEDARRLLRDFRRQSVPFDVQHMSERAFVGLCAVPDAEDMLQLWMQERPHWCPTPWDQLRFLEDMVDRPLDLMAAQLDLMHQLPYSSGGYSPVRDRMQALCAVSVDHVHAITAAIKHVAPHVQDSSTLLALAQSLICVKPELLRRFVRQPLDLSGVSVENEGYMLHMLAQDKDPEE